MFSGENFRPTEIHGVHSAITAAKGKVGIHSVQQLSSRPGLGQMVVQGISHRA